MKLFGTDGIRGLANQFPMTVDIVMRTAMAATEVLGRHPKLVVIGKDTRLSGYSFEPALVAGFTARGIDVVLLGVLPTPAVAALTASLRADMGVMISASHNPFFDNGIKIFNAEGFKLSDAKEAQIEALVARIGEEGIAKHSVPAAEMGRVRRLDGADGGGGRYIERVKSSFPSDLDLTGLRIVLDCAHGAAYRVAPRVLKELDAQVILMGADPDGVNINQNVGATATDGLRALLLEKGAQIGIALDGDADRVILIDEHGRRVDGDQILAAMAQSLQARGALRGGQVVATEMSNLGLTRYLEGLGLGLIRTPVGDRQVMQAMQQQGCNLGGEQSGHMILSDFASTGDGLVTALQILAEMVKQGRSASEVTQRFTPFPQRLTNLRFTADNPLNNPRVQAAIKTAKEALAGQGRVFVRKSGTEPLIRIMVEAEEAALVEQWTAQLVDAVEAAL